MHRVASACAVLAIVTGCARRVAIDPHRVPPPPGGSIPVDVLRRDPAPLLAEVASLRGLPQRWATPVVFQSEEEFLLALRRKAEADAIRRTISDSSAFQLTFSRVLPSVGGGNTPAAVEREQVIAFYDFHSRSVFVRGAEADAGEVDQTAWVLAHELGHALQHQHFLMPRLAEITDEDTRLAHLAMLEGDPMVLMLAYVARHSHVPLTRAIVRATAGDDTVERFERARGMSSALDSAPANVRERVLFPYREGLRFMGALYRAGGFPLLGRVYASPPSTTEQVLHPEKYLAGELPAPVRAPGAPPGFEILASSRLGELQTRVALAECLDPAEANAAAAGWDGDAYTIAHRDRRQLVFLWVSSWDTDADAAEFERAARAYGGCLEARQNGAIPFAPGIHVERSGRRVVFARGVSAGATASIASAAIDLVGATPRPVPSLPGVVIPPVRVPAAARPPYFANGRYVNEHIGVAVPAPRGYAATLSEDGVQWERPDGAGLVIVDLSERMLTTESAGAVYDEFATALAKRLHGRRLFVAQNGRVSTPLGEALVRTWQVDVSPTEVSMILVPLCRGTGSLIIAAVSGDAAARGIKDWVVSGLIRTGARPPPVCARLDP